MLLSIKLETSSLSYLMMFLNSFESRMYHQAYRIIQDWFLAGAKFEGSIRGAERRRKAVHNRCVSEAIVKPFLDTRTARKVKFVYSNDAASMNLLSELFDSRQLEELLREDNFNLDEYSKLMRQDNAKFGLERKIANVSSTQGD